ncbi:FtsX-like permease family protein [Streptomyces canus]|uniref:FtsX-like permease family protein n=1 Tax=Streptomyces canus TaxID=58343 RepID=UPI00225459EE|nr:FtsX-like permease family protein [Streptomyces canus]MCX4860179.1 ABC transporter permease [Streptomyces canus]
MTTALAARTGSPLTADLRLAWLLTRGSDRREWWRIGLTAVGAALATGIGLAVAALNSLDGYYSVSFGAGLLDSASDRRNVSLLMGLLLVPVLGFLGQCARIGAVHRDRRLAALRLAGAGAWQVRRIAALESGPACLAGSLTATAVFVPLLHLWTRPTAFAWTGVALVAVAVPVLGAAVSALSLRRVVASPLGWVRRVRPVWGPGRTLRAVIVLLGVAALFLGVSSLTGGPVRLALGPLALFAVVLVVGAATVSLAGTAARRLGGVLAARAQSPALLIAAERLRDDPWAAARTHAAVLLVTVVGAGFVGVRQVLLAILDTMHREGTLGTDMAYYTTGIDLTAAAILVALALTVTGLAVGTVESLATRRRSLAAQVAAGVPYRVLARALLLETALPLAPAVAVAGLGGTGIGAWYASLTTHHSGTGLPYAALLVPVAVYAACLLAAATSLPLLRRSVRPAELRHT